MKNYLIAERYAKGLSAAIEADADLEAALGALEAICALYDENHDLRSVLANPAIDVGKREAVLVQILEGDAVPQMVRRLCIVLLQRGRIALLPDVSTVFSSMADERLNRVEALLTTAVALDEEQEQQLGQALEQYSGKTVRLKRAVDEEVLGGVVAKIGSTVIDGSVRTRLEKLRHALLVEEK